MSRVAHQNLWTALGLLAAGLLPGVAQANNAFGDAYFEAARLTRASTSAGLLHSRLGLRREWPKQPELPELSNTAVATLEHYVVLRIGADARTLVDRSDAVYNDNFVFAGLGTDALPAFIPGVRLTAQVGRSFDLTSKISRSGFDFRVGAITYHELGFGSLPLLNEFYSEALYAHRYRDFFASLHHRLVYRAYHEEFSDRRRTEAAPLAWIVASTDSAGLDYNRFLEARAGARATAAFPVGNNGSFSLSLIPFFVWGMRWHRPTHTPNYQDFRVILTGSLLEL